MNISDFIDFEYERVSDSNGIVEIVGDGFEKQTDFFTVYGRLEENPSEVVALADFETEKQAIKSMNLYIKKLTVRQIETGVLKCKWFLSCENKAVKTALNYTSVFVCFHCIVLYWLSG